MTQRKSQLTITTIIILIVAIVGCSSKHTSKINSIKDSKKSSISSKDVELVNRVGGLPFSKWKVLFAQKDSSTINEIVTLVNSASRKDFNEKDYGSGKKIGYPISIEIKLQNDNKWRISPLFKIHYGTMEDSAIESSAVPYEDRVKLEIENGNGTSTYTLFSQQLANYVLKTAYKDMPSTVEFSHTPDTIRPGEIITISGDGSTEKFIEIYISDGNSASNENYLIAKVPTTFGAWKWEGTINCRTIRTLDGKDIKLTRNLYYFGTKNVGGGTIDLTGSE